MPKPNKQHIIDSLIKQIAIGTSFGTCLKLSATKWNLTKATFVRRWNDANKQHTEAQQAIKKELAEVDKQAAIESRKKVIMTAEERKEFLTKIVNGEIKIKKPFVISGKIMEYPAEPDHMDRLKALSELNKMGGDYAPLKTENKHEVNEIVIKHES